MEADNKGVGMRNVTSEWTEQEAWWGKGRKLFWADGKQDVG